MGIQPISWKAWGEVSRGSAGEGNGAGPELVDQSAQEGAQGNFLAPLPVEQAASGQGSLLEDFRGWRALAVGLDGLESPLHDVYLGT